MNKSDLQGGQSPVQGWSGRELEWVRGEASGTGLSLCSFWVTRLSPLDDGSPSRFYSQPHRGLPGDHKPRPHG